MEQASKIAKNSLAHISGRLAGVVIGVLSIGLLTRYLGQSGFGQYSTILAFVMLTTVFADLGLYMVTLKLLGQDPKKAESNFNNIFTLRLVSGGALVLLVSSIIWLFPYPAVVKLGIIIYSVVAWISLLDQIIVAGLQNALSTTRVAIAEIIGKLVLLGVIALTIAYDLGLLVIIAGHIIGLGIHTLLNYAKLRQFLNIRLSYNKQTWQGILKLSLPIALSSVFTMIYFKADTLFLSLFRSPEEVGIYGAPYRALEVLISFAPLFMGLIMPLLSRAWEQSKNITSLFQKTFDVLIILAVMLVSITLPLAEQLMTLIAGDQFLASADVLRILILATAIIYLAHLTTYSVVAIGKQKAMIRYYIAAALLAVTGYITLIPLYSYWAAAWVTVGVELFILISSFHMVRSATPLSLSLRTTLKGVLAGAITALALTQITSLSVLISLPLGIGIYTLILLATKAISPKQLTLFKGGS